MTDIETPETALHRLCTSPINREMLSRLYKLNEDVFAAFLGTNSISAADFAERLALRGSIYYIEHAGTPVSFLYAYRRQHPAGPALDALRTLCASRNVALTDDTTLHVWLSGTAAAYRGRGHQSQFLAALVRETPEAPVVTLNTYPKFPAMLRWLEKEPGWVPLGLCAAGSDKIQFCALPGADADLS
jgi:ribosomal protein S18 acetylase RimI-like enzyme